MIRRSTLLCAAIAGALVASCNPVHDDAVDALGGETPGVPRGPLHRPGQPCLTCHDGAIGDPPAFSVAGTIFQTQGTLAPAENAMVKLTDANGREFLKATNAAGNFYIQPHEFTPTYPMHVEVSYASFPVVKMSSGIGRDGSCADCHSDPASASSSGHIYIPVDGVTP
jgi:hypothetical protein